MVREDHPDIDVQEPEVIAAALLKGLHDTETEHSPLADIQQFTLSVLRAAFPPTGER